MDQLRCSIVDHDAYIDGICMEKSCKNNRIMCMECINTIHKDCNSKFYTRKQFLSQLAELRPQIQQTEIKEVLDLKEIIQQLMMSLHQLDQHVNIILDDQRRSKDDLIANLDQILENKQQLTANNWNEGFKILNNKIKLPQNFDLINPQLIQIQDQIAKITTIQNNLKSQSMKEHWDLITREKPRSIATLHYVYTFDLSPDQKYIASAGAIHHSIQIWDPNTGKQVGNSLDGHTNAIFAVKYSQCGSFIISSSYDQTIRQWDTKTHKQIGEAFKGHNERIDRVSYTFDLKYIVSCSEDKTIRVWNPKNGQESIEKRIEHSHPIYRMALSPILQEVAFANSENKIFIWNYDNHMQSGAPLIGHQKYISSITYSNDSKLLLSCSQDLTIRIWDLSTRKQSRQNIVGHTGYQVYSANFSPNMKYIVSGGSDKTVRIWDRSTGKQIGECLLHHKDEVIQASFSRDGKFIITGGRDKQIMILQNPWYELQTDIQSGCLIF